jgi:SAM-dependent methyltransferase
MTHDDMLMRPDEYRVMFECEDHYWWYRGLRVLLKGLLDRYANRNSTPMILDAGCGTGANLQLLQAYGHAIGVDLAEPAIGFCRARGIPRDRALVASLTDLPFPDQFFDLAVSFVVICNIPDDVAAFAEIARVLKPGRRLIVQLPAYQWLWSTHDDAVGHQRRYSTRSLREKLTRAGWVPERVTYTNTLLFPVVAVGRWARRVRNNGRPASSDLATPLPDWLNSCLSAVATAEMRAAARMSLPVGSSVLAVARNR